MIDNAEYISKGLILLNQGLHSFVYEQMKVAYGSNWWQRVSHELPPYKLPPIRDGRRIADTQWLLTLIADYWDSIFGKMLQNGERKLISDLRTVRRDWAHQVPFNPTETLAALECMLALLRIISAEQVQYMERLIEEFLTPLTEDDLPPVPEYGLVRSPKKIRWLTSEQVAQELGISVYQAVSRMDPKYHGRFARIKSRTFKIGKKTIRKSSTDVVEALKNGNRQAG